MARIRSVHPGQNQDEDFVEMSAEARLVCILLRCEADDQGIFEWKPKGLKMRLIPGDDWDMAELLAEMVASNQVMEFSEGGKRYGAIRNFRKYQRPKKPNAIHPSTEQVAKYVGLKTDTDDTSSEPVPNQCPTASEIAPQMEDGGGRMEEEEVSEKSESPVPRNDTAQKSEPSRAERGGLPVEDAFEKLWAIYPKRLTESGRSVKVGKQPALAQFRKLNWDERRAAFAGVRSYAEAAGSKPVDAERYLKRRLWEGLECEVAEVIPLTRPASQPQPNRHDQAILDAIRSSR